MNTMHRHVVCMLLLLAAAACCCCLLLLAKRARKMTETGTSLVRETPKTKIVTCDL